LKTVLYAVVYLRQHRNQQRKGATEPE